MSSAIKYADGSSTVSGAGRIVPALSVATLAGLLAIDDLSLDENTPVWVGSLRATWRLAFVAPSAPDSMALRASKSGTRQWVREAKGNPFWAAKTAFYVNADTGDDEAVGDLAHPLRSIDEVLRRLGKERISNANGWITIFLLTPIPIVDADYITIDAHPEALISIKGYLKTPVFSGTIASLQIINGALNNDWRFTSAGHTFSETKGIIVLTSGLSAGASTTVLRDLGGGVVRTTGWRSLTDYGGVYSLDEATPTNGNTFDAYTDPFPAIDPYIVVSSGYVELTDVELVGGINYGAGSAGIIQLNRCVNSYDFSDWTYAYLTRLGTGASGAATEMNTSRGPFPPYTMCCAFRGIIATGGRDSMIRDSAIDAGATPILFSFLQIRGSQRLMLQGIEQVGAGGFGIFTTQSVGIDIHPSASVLAISRVFGAVPNGDVVNVHSEAYFGVSGANYPTASFGAGKNIYHLGENNAAGRFAANAVPNEDPAGTGARVIADVY